MTVGTGIGPLQIIRRVVNPNRDDLSFSVEVAPPIDVHDIMAFQANINAVLDVIGEVTAREQLKSDLVEKRKALKIAQQQPIATQRDIERLRVDRAAYFASRAALRPDRRLAFKPNEKQKADLDKFDQQIAVAELARKNFMQDIPIIEWEITCLVARLNGEAEPSKPVELETALDELSVAA